MHSLITAALVLLTYWFLTWIKDAFQTVFENCTKNEALKKQLDMLTCITMLQIADRVLEKMPRLSLAMASAKMTNTTVVL